MKKLLVLVSFLFLLSCRARRHHADDCFHADVYYNKGNVEYNSGNYINIIWDYYTLLEINPQDTDCKEMLEQTAEILFSNMGEE